MISNLVTEKNAPNINSLASAQKNVLILTNLKISIVTTDTIYQMASRHYSMIVEIKPKKWIRDCFSESTVKTSPP